MPKESVRTRKFKRVRMHRFAVQAVAGLYVRMLSTLRAAHKSYLLCLSCLNVAHSTHAAPLNHIQLSHFIEIRRGGSCDPCREAAQDQV